MGSTYNRTTMHTPSISHAHRLELLARCPALSPLPALVLEQLAKNCQESFFSRGEIIVAEGDMAHSLCILAKGAVVVTQRHKEGTIKVGELHAGDLFGEMGLLAIDQKRTATVVAQKPSTVLKINRSEVDFLSQEFPHLKKALLKIAEVHAMANALRRNAYFSSLDGVMLRELTKRVQSARFDTNDIIVKQNTPGNSCYYIKSGEVEIYRDQRDGSRESLARLSEGEIFGETAVLTGMTRNASVMATRPTELLIITQADLSEIMSRNQKVARSMINLLFLRNTPQKSTLTQREELPNGLTRLKNTKSGKTLDLDEEEQLIWDQIDGKKNLRDLTLAFHQKFKVFVPQRIADILSEFTAGEFLEIKTPFLEFGETGKRTGLWQNFGRVMERKVILHDIDETLTKIYDRFLFVLWSWPMQFVYLAIIVLGFKSFLSRVDLLGRAILEHHSLPPMFLILVPLFLTASVVHEMAHAFTVKKFGRTVLGLGVGWHWIGPAIFVDTSDMWTAPTWQRVLTRLAGLYAHLILAGMTGLALQLNLSPQLAQGLWFFSLTSYILVLVYLNPFIKSYGYMAWREKKQSVV